MFQNLIRRLSYSMIPRPDRPWADDATSNAPQKRKRRLSISEQDGDEESIKKKIRSVTSTPVDESKPIFAQPETKEVKEVTAGVKEVDLEDKPTTAVAPEAIPLPEGESNELDEPTPSSEASDESKQQDQEDAVNSTPTEAGAAESEPSATEGPAHKHVQEDKESEETPSPDTTSTKVKPDVEDVSTKLSNAPSPKKD